jgi:hypothetical protein
VSAAKAASPAAQWNPILMLMRTGHLGAAAFLMTMATAKNKPQAGKRRKLTTSGGRFNQEAAKNIPPNQCEGKGITAITVPVVINGDELRRLLLKAEWAPWLSNVRVNALLLLVADAVEREKAGAFDFGRDRARALCSPLDAKVAAANKDVSREGLAVLTGLGVFHRDFVGVSYPQAVASEFRFGERYASRKRFRLKMELTPKLADKWARKNERVRELFERRTPVVGAVRRSARRLGLSDEGVREMMRLHRTKPDSFASAANCFRLVDGQLDELNPDKMKTIHSDISRCPKEIRPHLLLDGEPVVEMDISGAHLIVVTKIYEPAFLVRFGVPHEPADAERERRSLVEMIETGDAYAGETEEEKQKRDKSKKAQLTSLNIEVKVQMAMKAAQRLSADRPIFRAVMWAVKRKNHRSLSQWLQRWLSDIVNAAVVSLDADGIPSIPIVDCLMVRQRDEARARDELASRIYAATGVCAKVGGIRYVSAEGDFRHRIVPFIAVTDTARHLLPVSHVPVLSA